MKHSAVSDIYVHKTFLAQGEQFRFEPFLLLLHFSSVFTFLLNLASGIQENLERYMTKNIDSRINNIAYASKLNQNYITLHKLATLSGSERLPPPHSYK